MAKLLFVCNSNSKRSPTFQNYFQEHQPQFDVRSAGTVCGYPTKLDAQLVAWADLIFVMDMDQAKHIHMRYRTSFHKVHVVGISDDYEPDEPQLISLIDFWVATYFPKIYDEWRQRNI